MSIVVRGHTPHSGEVELTHTEQAELLAELAGAAPAIEIIPALIRQGFDKIRFETELGGTTVNVQPWVPLSQILRLATYALELGRGSGRRRTESRI